LGMVTLARLRRFIPAPLLGDPVTNRFQIVRQQTPSTAAQSFTSASDRILPCFGSEQGPRLYSLE
jgi:hypothetical protein